MEFRKPGNEATKSSVFLKRSQTSAARVKLMYINEEGLNILLDVRSNISMYNIIMLRVE